MRHSSCALHGYRRKALLNMREPCGGDEPTMEIEVAWLMQEVGDGLRRMESSRPDSARQMAASALARMDACLEGVWVLIRAGRSDLTGLIVRHAWECWLVGVYLALAGNEAFHRLAAEHRRTLRAIVQEWPGPRRARDYAEFPPIEPSRLMYEQLARDVDVLLAPRGLNISAVATYNALYRTESRVGAHASFGLLVNYLEVAGDQFVVRGRPASFVPDDHVEVMVATYMAHLAILVFELFDLDGRRVESLFRALLDLEPQPDRS